MALARVQYTQTVSGNQDFLLTFPYLSKDHVKVFVNEEPVDYSWLNPQLIQLDEAPAVGDVILIKRVTERNVLLVDFQDASTITEDQLDLLGKQSFYLVQEADDLAVESNALARAATEVAQAADEKADQAIETANTASDVADEALAVSLAADAKSTEALATSGEALEAAEAAEQTSLEARDDAAAARTTAEAANTTAEEARDTANAADTTANEALTAANEAVTTAGEALETANEALGNSEVAVSLANAASISATEAEASALAANEAAQAAAEDASTATQTAAQIEDTVEQLLEDIQDIAGGDLTDFAKNSENLSGLTDKAAARENLGLGAVDNTSDLDKPVSTATQQAIDALAQNVEDNIGSVVADMQDSIDAIVVDIQDNIGTAVSSLQDDVAAVQAEKLTKAENLADVPDKAAARSNLGLGSAALYGDGDFWRKGRALNETHLNTLGHEMHEGAYYQNQNARATGANGYPVELAGTLLVTPSAYGCQQMYITFAQPNRIFTRGLTGAWNGSNGPWSPWTEVTHWNAIQGKPATFPPTGHTHHWSQISGVPHIPDVAWTIAGMGAGGIGTYAFLGIGYGVNYGPGTQLAGSQLHYASTPYFNTNATAGGSWRCMGHTSSTGGSATLWLRYA